MALCIIVLLFLLQNQSSSSYKQYSLDQLCPSERANAYVDTVHHIADVTSIDMHDSPATSSVLLEHVWSNSSYKHFHHCEFNVKTRSEWLYGVSSGLFVAIRELNFRQNLVGECIDYIIFELNTVLMPTSHKICGTVSGDESVRDIKNYFEIPEGYLKIIIHIGPHSMEPNEIAIKLTFTAFEDCSGAYKLRCSNGRCISGRLYDDLIVNCFPPFCADEPRFYNKCGTRPTYITPNTHVLAIGSSLVLVIFGVAMAWYFLKIYINFSRYFGSRVTTEQVAFNPMVEYQSVYVPPSTENTSLGEVQSGTDDPPSYESLFKRSETVT